MKLFFSKTDKYLQNLENSKKKFLQISRLRSLSILNMLFLIINDGGDRFRKLSIRDSLILYLKLKKL